jgi:hypothetical protein
MRYPACLPEKRMSSKTTAKLAETKAALAAKYYNLAKVAKSKPKRDSYLYHADRYRRQAQDLARE